MKNNLALNTLEDSSFLATLFCTSEQIGTEQLRLIYILTKHRKAR